MVEVFKTNVMELCDAEKLIQQIRQNFCHYSVNFDLEDCDKILRIEYEGEAFDPEFLKELFTNSGFDLRALPD